MIKSADIFANADDTKVNKLLFECLKYSFKKFKK